MAKNIDFKLTPRQAQAWKLLTGPESCAVLYGGAKGGGKSWFFVVWLIGWLEQLIKLYALKPSKNPPILGFIGRKQSTDFCHTTLETFRRIIPAEVYRIKEQSKEIVYRETARVWYGGLDDRETINKFNSAELAFIGLDQAEETERSDVEVMQAALRFKIGEVVPPYKELYTANPAECWLKEDFIDNKKDTPLRKLHYIPALPSDNPHLPGGYCERLSHIFRHNTALLSAYLRGDWSALQAANVLITSQMLEALKDITRHIVEIKTGVVCDPSMGGDECVIYVMRNNKIVEEKIIIGERDTMKVAGEMQVLANKWRTREYAVDCIGMGRGIADRLRELAPNGNIQYVNSSEKSFDEARFYNRRAEMWWYAMEQILEKNVAYPEDEELRRQLVNVRFKVCNSDGQIQIEPKDQVKKRIGHSPDRGDCWIYGVWATQFMQVLRTKDVWRDGPNRQEIMASPLGAMAI